MEKQNNWGIALAGIFAAAGLAFGGYFIGQTIYNGKVAFNTAEVRGLAERQVLADHATWRIAHSRATFDKQNIAAMYQQAEQDRARIIAVLKQSGFQDEEIGTGVLRYQEQTLRDDQQRVVEQSYRLDGVVGVDTDNVHLVAKSRENINKLLAEGLVIENRNPRYLFTKLNDIKPEMLRQATQSAREAANEFAQNANVAVGGIKEARQGNFTIRDVGSEYEDSRTLKKDVRVVTNITFYLTQ